MVDTTNVAFALLHGITPAGTPHWILSATLGLIVVMLGYMGSKPIIRGVIEWIQKNGKTIMELGIFVYNACVEANERYASNAAFTKETMGVIKQNYVVKKVNSALIDANYKMLESRHETWMSKLGGVSAVINAVLPVVKFVAGLKK